MNLLYPPICVLCQKSLFHSEPVPCVCPRCLASIKKNTPPFCRKCTRPISKPSDVFCRNCRHSHFHFDHAYAACLYTPAFQRLLHLYKYGNFTAVRKIFASLMIEFIDLYAVPVRTFDFIIPVPLHPVRQRERGYNQSHLMALELSRHYKTPYNPQIVRRNVYSLNQARVRRKQRWTNVESAFKIKSYNSIINTNILIVDDLLTTGATLSSLAKVLKSGGAKKVSALTAAIAE